MRDFVKNVENVVSCSGFFAGCGLASKNKYLYGFFSAAIKLPSGLSPGVVFAFYVKTYPHNHDEIDFEILGHDRKNDWNLQTNVYANGSVNTGREEKFNFWFDPTQDYHNYSIIWNSHHIVFLVDSVPVREYKYQSAYPLKPMNVYATIWDGSEWATHGGKYPVNYKYAPFVVSIGDAELAGCIVNPASGSCSKGTGTGTSTSPSSLDPVDGSEFASLSNEQSLAMDWARRKLMFYSYCSDKPRYKIQLPECK
ncbi:Probable xyloglucan endotransglucosylase/hydrolase protein 33 [Linum perenne]